MLVIEALATAAITMTLTRGTVFRPLRLWVIRRSSWFGKLVTCPYCMSHWIALMVVWPSSLAMLVSVMAVVATAAPIQWVIFKSIGGITMNTFEEEELNA